MDTVDTATFYMKIVKVRPGLKLNELDKIAEKEIILPQKKNLPSNETTDTS